MIATTDYIWRDYTRRKKNAIKEFVALTALALLFSLLFVFTLPEAKGRDYPAGQGTRSVFASDLDNDGDMDICAVNSYDGTVSVFSNEGNGSLTLAGVYSVGSFPISVYAYDMNMDDLPEIVVSNYISGTISILQNNGQMSFGNISTITTGTGPIDVVVDDMDEDGQAEILVANYESSDITVVRGSQVFTLAVNGTPSALGVADLNHDGMKEVVVVFSTQNMVRFYSLKIETNSLSLLEYASIQVAGKPKCVSVDDMDNDNEYEVITAGYTDNILYIISATDYSMRTYPLGGNGPHSIATGDIDGNGLKDIAVALSANYTGQILGQESLRNFSLQPPVPTGNLPLSICIADLDNNHTGDIITANFDSGSISVLINGEDFEYIYVPQSVIYTYSVDILDVNAYYDHKIYFKLFSTDGSPFTVIYQNTT